MRELVQKLNPAEKLITAIFAVGASVSGGTIMWMAHNSYSTSVAVASLKTQVTDQIQNTNARLNRMQLTIDRLTAKVENVQTEQRKQQ